MYKSILAIAFLCFIFLGCSKEDEEPEPVPPQMVGEVTGLDLIEERYGLTIPNKESLTDIDIRPSRSIITINAVKEGDPVAYIVDTLQRRIISKFTFDKKPVTAKLPYGESVEVSFSLLHLRYKTDTHLYGIAFYNLDQSSSYALQTLFVSEIKTNKIIENDPQENIKNSSSFYYNFLDWYNGTLLIKTDKTYRMVGSGNKTLDEGEHEKSINMPSTGESVSMTKKMSYKESEYSSDEFVIYNIETNTTRSISYDPRDNDNDRAEVTSITSDGEKIATVKFKLTTYEGEKSDKTVKVDFVDYKIVE